MARNGLGTYNLPAGNPVVTGTTISTGWANTTLNDIAAALTQSVSADGQTPFTGAITLAANSALASAPANGDSTTKIPTTGWTTNYVTTYVTTYVTAGFVQMGTGIGQNAQVVKLGGSTGGKLKATLDTTDLGNVGVSKFDTLWTAKQTFQGSADFTDTLAVVGGGSSCFIKLQNNTGSYLLNQVGTVLQYASNDSVVRTSISNAGVITCVSLTQTSDERKKENWRPLTDAQLDALAKMDMAGVFDWRADSNHEGSSIGGSAQEIRTIVPEAVYEDSEGNLSVNYGGLAFAMQQATLRRLWG